MRVAHNLFISTNLGDERVRKLFMALTGDNPARATWSSDWQQRRKLRNDVAHKGKNVTLDEAASCIDSVIAFIEHVSGVVEKTLKP